MTAEDKATLYRELAKLIGADFHFDRSIKLLLGQNPPAARRQFLEGMERGLARGVGVAAAIESENKALVTGMEIALVTAGERSGRMAETFEHLAGYFATLDDAMRAARGALVYPLILVHLAVVLPELPAAFAGQNASGFFVAVLSRLGVLWLAILVVAWAWRALSAAAVSSVAADRVLRRLPFIGATRAHWALARLAQVFHAGLLAALRVSEITRIAGEASQSGQMREGAERAADGVEAGQPLSISLRATSAFPSGFVDGVATAEEVGSLDREMQRWAEIETDAAAESTRRAALWLPKIAYALVALYVGWRVISMFFAIYAPVFKLLPEI